MIDKQPLTCTLKLNHFSASLVSFQIVVGVEVYLSPAWDDVSIIYKGSNWKKGTFKEAARRTSQHKEQLMNKKYKRKTISNLRNIVLNNKI